MTKKSKQRILIDTVVIIDAHENGYWEQICNAYQIAVPAFVIENEAFYFDSDNGKIGMNPTEWLRQGKITRMEAELKDFETLQKKISIDFMTSIDEGEREALAILISTSHDILFTTADRAAIKALGVLGLGFRGISVEEILKSSGTKRKGNLNFPVKLTKKWFQQILTEGLSEQHLWLKSPSS